MAVDPRIGRAVGKWRVESVLGSGGTATVYVATCVEEGAQHGTKGALKIIHSELSQNPKTVKMLLAEARLVAAVDHPGTVKVLDDGLVEGCAFLVFELLAGQTLEALRQAHGGRIPLDEVMRVGEAVMGALDAVHHAGIVHRDMKPANIYMLAGGGVKLLDFGFAKLRGYTADAAQDVFGTPSFMPPEQALGLTKKVDAQSDIWSLGATLFTALSGQPVHIAKHMNAMMLASSSTKPRSLAEAMPELTNSKVVAVIDKALAYRKADRWPNIAAMCEAWKEAHPSWLPPLPPVTSESDSRSDPSFLDTALLVSDSEMTVPGSSSSSNSHSNEDSLFDPRDLLREVQRQSHPGPIPKKAPPQKTPPQRKR